MAAHIPVSAFVPATSVPGSTPKSSPAATQATKPLRKRGLWRRVIDAIAEARQRQVEREMANYVERSGIAFTDATEREIERRFS